MKTKRELLRELIEDKCLITGEFTLSNGTTSAFYFDCKRATFDGTCLDLISDLLLEQIDKLPLTPSAIGGLTVGADPIAAGVAMKAHQKNKKTTLGSIVRKEQKKHGTKKMIENELPPGTPIVVVEDVLTTGKSTLAACDEFEKAGYEVVGVAALVDREAGGLERIRKRYKHVFALFRTSDFPALVRHLKRHGPACTAAI